MNPKKLILSFKKNRLLPLVALASLAGVTSLQGRMVVADTFQDGIRTFRNERVEPRAVDWFSRVAGATPTIVRDDDVLGRNRIGLAYQSSTNEVANLYAHFDPVTLTPGQRLVLRFTFRGLDYMPNRNNRFGFGIYNSMGGPVNADGSEEADRFVGYSGTLNAHKESLRPSLTIIQDMEGSTTRLGQGGSALDITAREGVPFMLWGDKDAAPRTAERGNLDQLIRIELSIQRRNDGGLSIYQKIQNQATREEFTSGADLSRTATLLPFEGDAEMAYTFDTIVLGNRINRPLGFMITSVEVEHLNR